MTHLNKIQIAMLGAAAVLIGWEFRQHLNHGRELALIAAQSESRQQELDARQPALDALEQRNQQLEEAERQAGNQTLLALMRERAAYGQSNPEAQNQGIGGALAKVLDSPAQWDAEQEHLRNEMRAGLGTFFRLANLPPDKANQFIDLGVEAERRKAARLSGLLRGTLPVADALRDRDADEVEFDKQQQAVLGEEGYNFYHGIAEGMRNDEAKRLLKLIQQNMGDSELTQDQSDRLQPLIKKEIVSINMDDVELFRPQDEWAQRCIQHQENVLQAAADFLTPAQVEALRTIAAYDLVDRQKQMAARRQALGIK